MALLLAIIGFVGATAVGPGADGTLMIIIAIIVLAVMMFIDGYLSST
jgi:hypothetical protein